MSDLTISEQNELIQLKSKIENKNASSNDKKRFTELLIKSGQENKLEIENHLHLMGYNSIEKFLKDLEKDDKDDLISSLLIIGGAILFIILLKKLLDD